MEYEDQLVTIMSHIYTHLLLVEGEEFSRMLTHLDMYILPINRYKLTRTLILHKLKKAETYVSSFIDGVRCVVIYYDVWISNTTWSRG